MFNLVDYNREMLTWHYAIYTVEMVLRLNLSYSTYWRARMILTGLNRYSDESQIYILFRFYNLFNILNGAMSMLTHYSYYTCNEISWIIVLCKRLIVNDLIWGKPAMVLTVSLEVIYLYQRAIVLIRKIICWR